jgi:mono/diheme cytochrome c family protein
VAGGLEKFAFARLGSAVTGLYDGRTSMISRISVTIALSLAVSAARGEVSFSRQVAPILLEKCVTCHGPDKSKSGFRLDTFASMLKGGDSKKVAIKAGAPRESHLFELIITSDEDDRMPQKADRLTEAQISLIRDWIAEGAKFDGPAQDKSLASIIPFQPGPESPTHYPFPQPVLALGWSLDGKFLAGSGYHEVLVWDDSGKLARRVSRLPQRIHGLAFLDEKKIAVAAGTPGKSGEVLICDIESSEPPQLLARLADEVIALAMNRERTLLAAGGSDNSIHVFEMPSGKELYVAQQHADWVTALTFSPDGTKIASASRDRTARILETNTGNLLETYPDHAQALSAVAFSQDGKRAFSGGREKKVHAWQVEDGKKVGEFPALEGDVLALCVVGKSLFASGGEMRIHEFNIEDRKEKRALTGHSDWVYSMAVHEPSRRLASGSYNGEIRIWDLEKGETITAFKSAP